LAKELDSSGQSDEAADIRFFKREKERHRACSNYEISSCIGLTALSLVAGFGIGGYIFRVLYWVLGFSLLGVIVLFFSRAAREKGLVWCIGASFDRLLPVMTLNKEFEEFFNDPGRERLRGWQIAFFSVIAILGWVLGLFLVAAMTGLTQRS
jgi:hypothetical protein